MLVKITLTTTYDDDDDEQKHTFIYLIYIWGKKKQLYFIIKSYQKKFVILKYL